MAIKKDWSYKEYIPLDENIERPSYDTELAFYNYVKNGDINLLQKELRERPFRNKDDWGILSTDYRRNEIYHFVITVALIARVCIEGGLDVDDAYTLSDYYIQKADKTKTEEEIVNLHHDMVLDYAKRMRVLSKNKIYSRPILKCINYIYNHLNENITTSTMAEYIGLSRSYLSTLFKKETSLSIKEYITFKKLQTAENMLQYSSYSILDISTILAFSSQSYFTKLFKEYNGLTPKSYANRVNPVLTKKAK